MSEPRRLLIVGNRGGTNVGECFERAERLHGRDVSFADAQRSMEGPRLVRRLNWWLRGRRPPRLAMFEDELVSMVRGPSPPNLVLTTGTAPLRSHSIEALRSIGATVVNYSTDDPWNPTHRAPWFLEALPHYDLVCSTRRSNLADFKRLGCRRTEFVPFGYDPTLHFPEPSTPGDPSADVLFVGGGDEDRVPYVASLARAGMHVVLYGSYWDRYSETRRLTRGQAGPELIRRMTASAKIALCLVRRANRDGSCMRTFEIPAIGACALVEDTAEHREVFGADGVAVRYFTSPSDLVDRARWLLLHDSERERLASQASTLITTGRHTYADRLAAIVRMSLSSGRNA